MRPRIIVKQIKRASFKGKHNATKSKCLVMLEYSATSKEQRYWLTAHQLSSLTGISYGSVLASLPKWVDWKIVIRKRARLANGREVYIYQAAAKGRAWLGRHASHMPLQRYQAEVLQATGRLDELLS